MRRSSGHTIRRTRGSDAARLWYVVGAGFAAWSLHLLLSYCATSVACDTHFPAIDLVLHFLTVVAAAATLPAAAYGWRAWRNGPRRDAAGAVENAAARGAFMGLAGVGLSALFLIAIGFGGLTVFYLPPCG